MTVPPGDTEEWRLLDLVQSEHPPLKATGERQGLLWRQGLWDPAWSCPKDVESRPLTWAISEESEQKHHPGHDGVPHRSQLLSPLSCRWGPGPFHASHPMQITSSCPCPDHLMSPEGCFLKKADAGPHPEWGQHAEETLSDGVTAFP